MTVRLKRVIDVPADVDQVWSFIADPAKRAGAISVIEDYKVHDDERTTWNVRLPIPVVSKSITVETRERNRDPPTSVSFEGRSSVFHVVGEHKLSEVDGGTRLMNEFVVDGKLPGVERFFESRFDDELANLEAALFEDLAIEERGGEQA